ncbi:autotransporter domain-containing protein [Devosia sediminis]|uniref:Autotransporter domain-containing protein n=1 Tax=Devosia sediminis TaxID=2798801 RepID=A0A934IZ89_9HYPH|nr:autotransporter domain-containing protein [Devosia sediminis]MBJ3785830.1 autotransporter domain-containing protein [Devosia sediminis]
MLGVSAIAIVLLTPVRAETITYTNGENRSAAIVLTEDSELVAGSGVYATQSGTISGDYGIAITGGGRLRLSGANSHTGGTTIDGGTIEIAHESAFGTGAVTVSDFTYTFLAYGRAMAFSNDLVLVGSNSFHAINDATWAGDISGATGNLTFTAGHLALSGANTYGGGTRIGHAGYVARLSALSDQALGTGRLSFGDDATLTMGDGVTIANNMLLHMVGSRNVINSAGTSTLSGAMTEFSAGGGVIYNGGTIVRTGQDSHSGATRITGGAMLVAANPEILSDQSLVILDSGGTLRLLENQTVGGLGQFAGDTSGTLDLTNRRLTVTRSDNRTFGGSIVGTNNSRLELAGPGRLTLTGANSGWDGNLVATDGRLVVDGDFGSADAIINGAEISGTGRVGGLRLNQGATLHGVAGQTFTMSGLYISSGSVLSLSLGAANVQPLFHVEGTVELDGYIDIIDAGGFGPGVYTVLTYGGTLFNQETNIRDLPDGVEPEDVQLQLLNGRINIVSSAGADITFWDGGNAANWNNGRIDGGDGIWGSDDTFTTADGSVNGPVDPDPGFVVFGGTAGTVELADTRAVDGMQFVTDGYRIVGSNLEIASGERIFRAGDGTTAGAGVTATIDTGIEGDGRLVKSDAGRLILGADNTYSGGTEVRGGILDVTGRIGDVLVGADGYLTGSGDVGNAQVDGRIGASFGETLTVDGDLVLSENAIFELAVDALGNKGVVFVDGTAALDGTVNLLASGGDYADATSYTFLRAEGGVTGSFDGVIDNLAFLSAVLDYETHRVSLTLARNSNSFPDVAETANQRATAGAVEGLGAGNAVYDRVLTYDVADARNGFDQLSGEVHASSQAALLASGGAVSSTMSGQVAAALDNRSTSGGVNLWSTVDGQFATLRGDGNAADTHFSAGNIFFGGDAIFNGNWAFGAMGGYSATGVSIPARSSTADADSLYAGIYGGGEIGDTTLSFGSAVGVHHTDTTRSVDLPGFTQTLTAGRAGATSQTFAEIGHKLRFDSGLVIEPFANLTHTSLFSGTYAENGGAAALTGRAAYAGLTTVTLGLRGETSFALGEVEARATGMVGWRQAFGGTTSATHAFGTGSEFAVSGSTAGQSAALVSAGFAFDLTDAVELDFGYDGEFGPGVTSHGLKASLSAKF